MSSILLCGVGGQGTVLAAKVLAQAAQSKGWQVRTAETIGMAQRGGAVTSHVRMGDGGEAVESPLVMLGSADLIIAFEPGEAARSLPYLAPGGTLVTASTAVQPVTAALSKDPYRASDVIAALEAALAPAAVPAPAPAADDPALDPAPAPAAAPASAASAPAPARRLVVVDDAAILAQVGNRRALNTVLLASALATGCVPLSADDLRAAIEVCVKPRFVDLNLRAIDCAVG
ncbi:MAG: indolepyruvate oxidoreductase subunit beta [Eggerthellaceae bacterium]|nr:indolepyruvate oxidoreductase subunit beta [Eggerthellaceae bacterium]